MGDTSLVCGISAELCVPSAEKPGDGYIGITFLVSFTLMESPQCHIISSLESET